MSKTTEKKNFPSSETRVSGFSDLSEASMGPLNSVEGTEIMEKEGL